MSSDLRQACFELARITKWDLKPVDTAAIQVLSDRFYQIAKDQENADLDIDLALITRAVRYLANVHAIPPTDENTSWTCFVWSWKSLDPTQASMMRTSSFSKTCCTGSQIR